MTTDESITLSFTVYQAALKAGSSKPQVTATISGRIELPALLP